MSGLESPVNTQKIEVGTVHGSVTQSIVITLEGGAGLKYSLQRLSPDTDWTPAKLLDYRSRAVAFGGREAEIQDLRYWLTAEQQAAPQQPGLSLKTPRTRLYHAPAGEGKSRLLQELCLELCGQGWTAGCIEVGGLQGAGELAQTAAFATLLNSLTGNGAASTRLLFVLDDLDAWPSALRTLHGQLQALPDTHWRIVGLARAADWEQGWLQDLARRDPALTPWPDLSLAQYPSASHGSVEVRLLAPGGRSADRAAAYGLYSQAIAGFHRIVRGPDAPLPAYPTPPGLGDAAATFLNRFLVLHTVALSAVLGADLTHLNDENRILSFAVNSELNSLERLCAPRDIGAQALGLGASAAAGVRPLHTLMGALILGCSPVSRPQQEQLLSALGCPPPQTGPLLKLMDAAYAREENQVWQSPFPALLAQHFVSMLHAPELSAVSGALADPGCQEFSHPAQGAATFNSLAARTGASADRARLLAFVEAHLPRLIPTLPTLMLAQPQPLLGVLEELFRAGRNVLEAQDLDRALLPPHRTVLFRPLLEGLRAQIAGEEHVSDAERARRLAAHALSLAQLGRLPEALARTRQALALFRPLAERFPQQFMLELTGHLNNLGNLLSELGQPQAALEAMREAVDRLRSIVAVQPQSDAALALALDNLGNRLAALDQAQEALLAAQESVSIYRRLAASVSGKFRPDLARSLGNLGTRLARLDCQEEALKAQQEALKLFRELSVQNPDGFRPGVALALNNLSNRLAAVNRLGDALDAAQEAVTLRRELAQQQPAAFAPVLADSLNNLGRRHVQMKDWPAAQAAYAEAARTLLPFARQFPQAYGPRLAHIYSGYVNACQQLVVLPDSALNHEMLAFREFAPNLPS